jgi:hypothetical protein
MGGARPIESEVDESDEDDMYVDESSEDDEDDDDDDDETHGTGGPSRHRLEWDNDIWALFGIGEKKILSHFAATATAEGFA